MATLRRSDQSYRTENRISQPKPEVVLKTETICVVSEISEGLPNEAVGGVMQSSTASNGSNLTTRELKRNGSTWLTCPLNACSAMFTEARVLKMHLFEKHRNYADTLLRLCKRKVCFPCNLQFDTEGKLIVHNGIHRKLGLELKCNVSRFFHSKLLTH